MCIFGLVNFVGEVDQELRVALDDEVFNPKGNGGSDTGEEALVLGDVVGDLGARAKAELHGVVELVAGW